MAPAPDLSGLAQALPELESSLGTDPSPRNVVRVAEAFRIAGLPDRAASLLEPLVRAEPSRIAPRVLLSWALADLGRVDESRAMMTSVRALDPANPFTQVTEPAETDLPETDDRPSAIAPAGEEAPREGDPEAAGVPFGESPWVIRGDEPATETETEAAQPVAPEPDAAHEDEEDEEDEDPIDEDGRFDPEWEAEPERALTAEELRHVPPSPLYSATLAEIFERQGFEEKAVEIYEEILRLHPDRDDLRGRIAELLERIPRETGS
jgi:tetratricopeptide (TPR) repeat protein